MLSNGEVTNLAVLQSNLSDNFNEDHETASEDQFKIIIPLM